MKHLLSLLPLLFLSACGSNTFHGYTCQDDCSGHKAGYAWAEEHSIAAQNNCLASSSSFQEGCFAYVAEHGGTIILASPVSLATNVIVKYRDVNPVDVGSSRFVAFSPQDKTVKNAYFDASNQYMIISLKGVYYHYCRFSQSDWKVFIDASSVDDFYKTPIKGNFDCRNGGAPTLY